MELTFQESWLSDEPELLEEYTEEHKLRILEDLGEFEETVENVEGIPELTIVHKYRVKQED